MSTTRKIISIVLTLCLLVSVAVVGVVPVSAETTYVTYAQETVQGGAILHCFDWSYNNIKAKLPEIAAAGYTAVQTSPVQSPKDYNASWTDGVNQWWKLYQPLGFSVSNNSWLGTKTQLTSLCAEAEKYNIKVVVDIVANHLANNGSDGGTYSYLNSGVESDLKNSNYYHTNNTRTNDDSRYNITQYHLGMPDLNTKNSYVQERALGLLEECIDCGVDGFRFDAAKHIETPTDSSSFASQFWPTVINGAKSYASTKGVSEPFFYGEILGSAGPNFNISNYTTYMAVTDNQTGDRALDKAYWTAAGELADGTYLKGASADKSVLWVESHDTYMGSSGSAWTGNTKDVTSEVINRAWAIVGARAESTALFFARPNSTMGAASTDTNWKSTAVTEVNKFKNHFEGTSEYLSSSGNSAYVERGTKGVVISKLDGGGSVNLTAHQMASGTYTDQVTGNIFTVSNGKISGTVGSTGVAVVYNTSDAVYNTITQSTLYLKPYTDWTGGNARFAMYVFNSYTNANDWVSMTAAGDGYYSAAVPEGKWTGVIFCQMDGSTSENNWTNKQAQTIDLFPDEGTNCFKVTEKPEASNYNGIWFVYGEQEPTQAEEPEEPSSSASSNTYKIYVINNAGWSKVAVHYWGDGETAWPGTDMTSISGTMVYEFDIPKNVDGIVFSDGASGNTKQTGNITTGIADGATWIIGSASSNNYPVDPAPDYYLVGSMNGWSNNDNYKFSIVPSDSGKTEYKLSGVELTAGANLKVHSSSDTWYPDGTNNDYKVTDAGTYNVYFRPDGNAGSGWHSGYFKLERVYTVTWKNHDGTVLETDTNVANGANPSYDSEAPEKESTQQYTYTFSGWKKSGDETVYTNNFPAVSGDVVYTAQFTETLKTYTVTWKNYDGTVLETDTDVAYGAAPSYGGETPTRESEGSTTYAFSGWSPQITNETVITQDTTYTARFSINTKTYTITWKDGDGNTIKTETCIEGVTPQYMGDTPTKTADAQYTYTFNGTWTPGVVAAEDDATYTAQFDSTVNKYTVTFKNYDNTVLQSSQVEYGTTPAYNGNAPAKPETLQYAYTFSGWSPQVASVTGEATYTAQFTENPVPKYNISVNNAIGWDDVYVYYWKGGENNSWPGTPMTADSDNFTYTASIPHNVDGIIFNNGNTSDMEQTGNIESGIADNARWAVSLYDEEITVNPVPTYYLVGTMTGWGTTNASTFTPIKNEDGLEEYKLSNAALSKDVEIKVYDSDGTWYPGGENYEVPAKGTYDVYFRPHGDGNADWYEGYFYFVNVTQYTITWKDGNGNTLKTETVTHGDTPEYDGATPTKAATDQYTYAFNNTWSPAITAATADATYTAQFTETVNKYAVHWVDYDDEELGTDLVEYGTVPQYTGETPTRAATAQYTYTFTGWLPTVSAVTKEITYKAVYQETVNTYTVIWKNGDTTLETDENVEYGETPNYGGSTPVKSSDDQYHYSFIGWSPAVAKVTGNVTYTAQFVQTEHSYTDTWDWEPDVAEQFVRGTADENAVIVTLKLTCSCGRMESHPIHANHTEINWDGKTPSCTEEVISALSVTYMAHNVAYTYDEYNVLLEPAGHKYDTGNPEWVWSFANDVDYSDPTCKGVSCQMILNCENCDATTSVNASVSYSQNEYQAATCTASGKAEYVAAAQYDGHNYSGTETKTIPPNGHDLTAHPAVSPTCTSAGSSEYWECETCHKYFADAQGSDEIAENSWVIPRLKIAYLDENGNTQNVYADPITSETTSLTDGWYYVDGNVTVNSNINITGDVKVILTDDNTLTVDDHSFGGSKNNEADLTIYSQSTGSHQGALAAKKVEAQSVTIVGGSVTASDTVNTNNFFVMRGGNLNTKHIISEVDITFSGGEALVDAKNGDWVSASSDNAIIAHNGNVLISGGSLTVYGDTCILAIHDDKSVTVTGGDTLLVGYGSGILSKDIIITGGKIHATADADNGAGLASYNEITISWTDPDNDYIFSDGYSSYSDTVNILKPFYDQNNKVYSIGAAENTSLESKGLYPYNDIGIHLAGHSISLDGSIGVNFYMELSPEVIENKDTAYMRFTIPKNGEPDVQDVPVKDAETKVVGDKTYYIFTCNVAAKEIESDITAQLFSGNDSSLLYTYSVKQYADYLINHRNDSPAYEKAVPLVEAMMAYGENARYYFDKTGDKPEDIDVDIPEFERTIYEDDLPAGVTFGGATLSLKSETTLSLYFNSDHEITLTCEDTGVTYETEKTADNEYVIRIRGIAAYELDKTFKVDVDGVKAAEYSALAYCCRAQNNSNTKLVNTVKALYVYWQQAVLYFNENQEG